jgi:hypothetical protein
VNENAAAHRQQNLYWNQMIELTVAAEYMRRYMKLQHSRLTSRLKGSYSLPTSEAQEMSVVIGL